ncbi:MAG: methyltransferase, CheR-type [Firmicutes bacterium]|nr:methyltransferase, CheR-type [Bacillota bacterium]
MEQITDQEFSELVQFIQRHYGINLSQKKCLVLGRLYNYIVQNGFESFSDYFQHIVNDGTGKAGTVLVNKLTTNHTYFFREPQHFEFLQQEALPYLSKNLSSAKDLRVWSAGCSTGEEPYTLAMTFDAFWGVERHFWDTKVLATDISTAALERAQKAIYPNSQLEALPTGWGAKYFCKMDEEHCIVKDAIRKEVIFRRFNLMNEAFPFKKKFHLIFCRNVMIYFDAVTKRNLINRFYDITEPGGYLFIGHSESVNRHESRYSFIAPAIYRKE